MRSGYTVVMVLILGMLMLPGIAAQPCYTVEKLVVRRVVADFNGKVAESCVYVTLVIDGNGLVNVTDKIAFASANGLSFLGTEPATVTVNGDTVELLWHNSNLKDKLVLKYSAPLSKVPVEIKGEIYVNKVKVEPESRGEVYIIKAKQGDIITYRVFIRNVFSINGDVPPLLLLITWTIDPDSFSVISYSPKPFLVTNFGSYNVYTWSSMLSDVFTVELQLRIRKISAWGEVALTSPKIEITLDPSLLIENYNKTLSELENSLKAVELMEQLASNVSSAMTLMADTLYNISSQLEEFSVILEMCANQSEQAAEELNRASQIAFELSNELEQIKKKLELLLEIREKLEAYIELLHYIDEYFGGQFNGEIADLIDSLLELNSNLSEIDELVENLDKSIELINELGTALQSSSAQLMVLSNQLHNASLFAYNTACEAKVRAEELEEKSKILSEKMTELTNLKSKLSEEAEPVKRQYEALLKLKEVYSSQYTVVATANGESKCTLLADTLKVSLPTVIVVDHEPKLDESKSESNKPTTQRPSKYVAFSLLLLPLALAFKAGITQIKRKPADDMIKEVESIIKRLEELEEEMKNSGGNDE